MGIWRISSNARITVETKAVLEQFAAKEHRSLGNLCLTMTGIGQALREDFGAPFSLIQGMRPPTRDTHCIPSPWVALTTA